MPARRPAPFARALATTIIGAAAAALLYGAVVRPWHLRWGASDAEVAAAVAGDELIPRPLAASTRGVTIAAAPEQIWPWIVQLGAERGGFYSHTWIEGMVGCQIVNADRVHPEWQGLQPGDTVKMCPGSSGPPAYSVISVDPGRALVLGHRATAAERAPDSEWFDTWSFSLRPQPDGSTRLIVRSRLAVSAAWWGVVEPGAFVMERGMLGGIKARAEGRVAAR